MNPANPNPSMNPANPNPVVFHLLAVTCCGASPDGLGGMKQGACPARLVVPFEALANPEALTVYLRDHGDGWRLAVSRAGYADDPEDPVELAKILMDPNRPYVFALAPLCPDCTMQVASHPRPGAGVPPGEH